MFLLLAWTKLISMRIDLTLPSSLNSLKVTVPIVRAERGSVETPEYSKVHIY